MRIVADSSVLFSGLYSAKGYAYELLMLAVEGKVTIVLSPHIFNEVQRAFSKKNPQKLPVLAEFLRTASVIPTTDPNPELTTQVRVYVVKKDAPVVALAIREKVDYLVSFDRKHILRDDVRQNSGLNIVTPDVVVKAIIGQ